MDLQELRQKMDGIDNELIELFKRRMAVSGEIAENKRTSGKAILDVARERAKLADVAEKAGADMQEYATVLYSLIFEMSRGYQGKILNPTSPLKQKIDAALDKTEKLFPQQAMVACQGVEGAYSQLACDKLFRMPNIMYFSNFESVFSAIENGMCRYGVLPLENSTAGSVNKIYDLMMQHKFSIVRSVRLKVDHNLLAKRGTKLSDITEIFSHEQAINQCGTFLKSLSNVKVTVCENTAMAAQMVSQSDRTDVAALSSRSCAELYELECLAGSVQDMGNNYTRFICISKDLEIYPGADKTSLMMVLPHRPGALYKVLARFYALGINLIKLESRPIPDRDFEFMFYFDIETSVYSPQFSELIAQLENLCDEFSYLGSYLEIV